MLNRRQFLKSLGAAAAVTALPIGGEWITAPKIDMGIEACGEGWYRCWFIYDDNYVSTYAKAALYPELRIYQKDRYARFDLEKGEVISIETLSSKGDVGVSADDAYFWGLYTEKSGGYIQRGLI